MQKLRCIAQIERQVTLWLDPQINCFVNRVLFVLKRGFRYLSLMKGPNVSLDGGD